MIHKYTNRNTSLFFVKLVYRFLSITGIVLLFSSLAFSSILLLNTENYKQIIQNSFSYELISDQAVVRSSTGWGSDRATECLSLSMGLNKKDRLKNLLINSYPSPREDVYNPCLGLKSWAFNDTGNYKWSTYARYWFGNSVFVIWLTYFFGIGFVRNFLFCFLLIGYGILIRTLALNLLNFGVKPKAAYLVPSASLLIYFFLSGTVDLINSIPHLLSELLLIFFAIIVNSYIQRRNIKDLFLIGICLGEIYVFLCFALNPQSLLIFTFTWVICPIILFVEKPVAFLFKGISVVLGISVGFVTFWATKLVIINFTTDFPIWEEFRTQLTLRSSQNIHLFSSGISQHFNLPPKLPAYLQSVVVNFAALLAKIWDPRFSSTYLIWIALGITLFCTVLITKNKFIASINKNQNSFIILRHLIFFVSFFVCLIWYSLLPQHSFDHATYTYRSLALSLSSFVFILTRYFFDINQVAKK